MRKVLICLCISLLTISSVFLFVGCGQTNDNHHFDWTLTNFDQRLNPSLEGTQVITINGELTNRLNREVYIEFAMIVTRGQTVVIGHGESDMTDISGSRRTQNFTLGSNQTIAVSFTIVTITPPSLIGYSDWYRYKITILPEQESPSVYAIRDLEHWQANPATYSNGGALPSYWRRTARGYVVNETNQTQTITVEVKSFNTANSILETKQVIVTAVANASTIFEVNFSNLALHGAPVSFTVEIV